ncbi:MAG: arginase family protein [Alphaproteobacteria bacterium]
MDEAEFQAKKAEMTPWYWWGIQTFFKCPWDEDPAHCDIALVGVPHSSGNGSTERDQHLGPRAVRNVSGWYRRGHQAFGIVPWEVARIHDLGDVPLPHAMVNDICVKDIEGFFKRLDRAGTRAVSVGGDHAITGPILKAIAGKDARLSGGQKCALLHFDAHRDDYEHIPHWLGSVRSAAHWAAYTVVENHVDPGRSVQLGMRGNPIKPRADIYQSKLGYHLIPAETYFELGIPRTVELIRERVGEAPLYVTLDLDVLDPAEAPAVANLEPMQRGLRAWEVMKILHGLRGLDVIGADLVCLIPSKDTRANLTAMTAMALMFELIALIADGLNGRRASA